jgi:hypothetical protein
LEKGQKLEINTQVVKCPKSGLEQPRFRIPKGIKEALWSG